MGHGQKIGTKTMASSPKYNIVEPCLTSFESSSGGVNFPLNGFKKLAIVVGTIIHKKEGRINNLISSKVDTFLPIQSIVVVTSPIGDHAPPALAAIIIRPANHNLSLLSLMSFLSMVMSTIVAVKLSIIADKINANMHIIHSRMLFFLVLMKPFMVANPLK